jgi:hypothetical protein
MTASLPDPGEIGEVSVFKVLYFLVLTRYRCHFSLPAILDAKTGQKLTEI